VTRHLLSLPGFPLILLCHCEQITLDLRPDSKYAFHSSLVMKEATLTAIVARVKASTMRKTTTKTTVTETTTEMTTEMRLAVRTTAGQ